MWQNDRRWPKRIPNIRIGMRRGWIPWCCGLLLFLLAVIYMPLQQQQQQQQQQHQPRRKPPTEKERSKINPDGEFLLAYDFLPSIQEETLQYMEQIDPATSLVSTNSSSSGTREIPIDEVHVKGLVHFGAWIFVTDATNQRVLLLKRGPQLVTCPNSWSLVGEHTLGDESPLTTAERAMTEELGITNHNSNNIMNHEQQTPLLEATRLLPHPIYYKRHYGPKNGNRIDRQLTYLWWIRLLRPYQELNDMLTLDEEVADLQWVSLHDLRSWVDRDIEKRVNGSPQLDFCHHTIQELLLLVLKSFESILKDNPP